MTDYYPLLKRALAAAPAADPLARQNIYRSARRAMTQVVVGTRTGAAQASLNEEYGEFDKAVARVEAEVRSVAPQSLAFSKAAAVSRQELEARVSKFAMKQGTRASFQFARTGNVFGEKLGQDVSPDSDARTTLDLPPEPANADKVGLPAAIVDCLRGVKEEKMSRLDELNKILRKLQSDSPGLEASALISEDGLMIASALTPELDETRVAGMTATLLNLGTRAAVELARGEVKEVIIRGERGYAVMIDAGRGALLLALANETAKLGLIFFDMHEAIRSLRKVL